ncbi:A kinase anchor protein 200 isoform 1-T3 [Cochliomyia hominivorax]
MGKAQSKRSVDITTETKTVGDDEITEKMEKIEDIDKKEVINGDVIISDKIAQERKDTEDVENDKDMTTEKDVKNDGEAVSADQNTAETPKEECGGSANTEEISPLADESIKKSKKEKVKKKWSFRSISFGKKDKQKPAKTEDANEDGSELTNGADTDEKTVTEPEDNQKDKTINEKEENTTEGHENGNATPQEIKGEQNEEKKSEDQLNANTANITNNTTTTTTEISETVQKETDVVSSEISEKTENLVIATSSTTNEIKTSEDAVINDATKNGNGVNENIFATEQTLQNDVTNATVEASSEKTSTMGNDVTNESSSTNGQVIEKIQQNGDHGESEQEIVEKSKEQNEVNFNIDNKISAATLDYNSSTSTNPSKIQIHVQDLNISSEKPDENINNNYNESIETPDHIEVKIQNNSQIEVDESVNTTEDIEVEIIENKDSETYIDNEVSTEGKVGIEPSPPPLPISPPPSQVSVFAFTNNESVENSSKDFERTIDNIVDEKEEIYPSSTSVCELSNTEITNSNEKLNEEKVNDSHIEQGIATECDKTQQEYRVLTSLNEEEISVATEVINEITEKAAAIVNEQLEFSEENIMDEQSIECNTLNQEKNKNDDYIKNECTVVEFDNEKQNNKEVDDVSGITNCSNENPIVIEQTNNISTDCSLDFSATNFIPDDQDQMSFLNKSHNLDEEHINLTKESANTKDLKDNVAAAEITKDLSVTCE